MFSFLYTPHQIRRGRTSISWGSVLRHSQSSKIDPITRRSTSLNVYRTFGETGVDSRLSRLVFMWLTTVALKASFKLHFGSALMLRLCTYWLLSALSLWLQRGFEVILFSLFFLKNNHYICLLLFWTVYSLMLWWKAGTNLFISFLALAHTNPFFKLKTNKGKQLTCFVDLWISTVQSYATNGQKKQQHLHCTDIWLRNQQISWGRQCAIGQVKHRVIWRWKTSWKVKHFKMWLSKVCHTKK